MPLTPPPRNYRRVNIRDRAKYRVNKATVAVGAMAAVTSLGMVGVVAQHTSTLATATTSTAASQTATGQAVTGQAVASPTATGQAVTGQTVASASTTQPSSSSSLSPVTSTVVTPHVKTGAS